MSPFVRVVGESLIDVVESSDGVERRVGGSPLNVAFGLGRLGVRAELLTSIGRDADGLAIEAHLASAGVALDPASRNAARTSTATARVVDGGTSYEFDIAWALDVPKDPAPSDWLHIGSIGAALDPGAAQLEGALTALAGSGVVSFDPNIRPALMPSRQDAVARAERLASVSDVVKLSDEDAHWLAPGRSDDAVLDALLEAGCRLAVLTRGDEGLVLASRSSRVVVPARRTRVVDTIGAGDTVMAALIEGLVHGEPGELETAELRSLGTIAAAAASITVARRGAMPPTREELDHALAAGESA